MQSPPVLPAQRRLKILGEEEIEALYGLPRFTPDERGHYFGLSAPEKEVLHELRSVKSQVSFLLQLGYFKAKHQFFVFDLAEVQEDVHYLLAQYGDKRRLPDLTAIDKSTRLKQQQRILALSHYRGCHAEERQQLACRARQAATICAKPIYIFRALMQYLAEQCLVTPGYSLMQDTIGRALTYEQQRLIAFLRTTLDPADSARLTQLLEDTPGLYALTQLKREPKDFSAGEIKREIHRGEQIYDLYRLGTRLLPCLGISNENITYYASLVSYYSVYKLKRREQSLAHLYLLCFIYHRYQRLQDHLVHSLLHHVRHYTDTAKEVAKERVYQHRTEDNEQVTKAGQVLKLFTENRIALQTPFHAVQAQAFRILAREQMARVAEHLTTQEPCDETAWQWAHLDTLGRHFKLHLRPVLLAVDWAASSGQRALMDAVHFLKDAVQKGRPLSAYPVAALPWRFVPATAKRYLYGPEAHGQKPFLPDRYEFLVYRFLRHGLEAGDVFCRDSVRFRSFEDDLIEKDRWQHNKAQLLAATGSARLTQPIRDHLAELEHQLEERLVTVNQRIASGDNPHFEIKKSGPNVRWTLHYPRGDAPVNQAFFETLKQVDIHSVMHFTNRQCQFMEAFEHVLGRYSKQTADERLLTACLVAWGTNMGLGRMGNISDIGYHTLAATSENFLRLETLKDANDRVSNAIAALPIFPHYAIGDTLHSSSDGQKFETGIPTINARYSPKYFGLKKGIVSYGLVANHVPINAEIIGANEHESHYVFDILFNNTTDIHPLIHSTDTHGTNEVNFAILHLFGYQFAPRYRDIYDKVGQALYGFQHPSQYDESWVLKPIRKINEALICEEWDNIQRIMVSLAQKTTTQHIIVRKLSAYLRKNKTRRALWEYDNIIRSLYLLEYIDSPPLRQHVQQALNRGESYHQLRRAVSYANFGKLRFKTEQEQHIWGECARLITNCIIYYNTAILSRLLAYHEHTGNAQGIHLLKHVSPIAWQHINFYGRYEFTKRPEVINIEAIIEELTHAQVSPEWVLMG